MELWRKKLIGDNYRELAKAVIDRAIEDTKIKKTMGKNSTELETQKIRESAIYFLKHFDGSLFDLMTEPSAKQREAIRKAAKL